LIKCLKFDGALTKKMMTVQSGTEFSIEGPFGKGLELTKSISGRIAIIVAGTGIAPFIELLDFLLKKKIYGALKKQGVSTRIVQPEQDYDSIFSDTRFEFYGAFRSINEFIGASWINTLAGLSKGTSSGLTECHVKLSVGDLKGYDHFSHAKKRFDASFLKQQKISECTRAYICGGPEFTTGTLNTLIETGLLKDKIVIV